MYDVIIIGAGVTGLAAGMYAGRLNLKTLVLGSNSGNEQPVGGVITLTESVENYPGFISLTGMQLSDNLTKHAMEYKEHVEIKEEKAESISNHQGKNCYVIKTDEGSYQSKSIIFATGSKWRKLQMSGAKEFESRGVHYCALCDGPIYKNKIVAIVGGSDTAAKEGLFLAEYAKKVYIIYRGDKLRPEPINAKRVEASKNIEVITNTNISEIKGDKLVNQIILDKPYNDKSSIQVDAVFGAIGSIPLSELAKSIDVKTNKKGEIIIDHSNSTTNIKGIFAAGDITNKTFKQAITGVAEGVIAAHSAYEYVSENDFVCTFYDPTYK